jgi:dephospho-CoA kinase
MRIIGLIGKIGVGKNYIAEKFNNKLKQKTLIVSFADHFKINSIVFEKLDYNKVFHKKDYYTRTKLQEIGTELGRNKYDKNIWCNILYNWMKVYNERGVENFIITDVRFENEIDFIRDLKGIIIKIVADDRTLEKLLEETKNMENIDKAKNNIINHESEKFISEFYKYDYLINNTYCNKNNIDLNIDNILNKIN